MNRLKPIIPLALLATLSIACQSSDAVELSAEEVDATTTTIVVAAPEAEGETQAEEAVSDSASVDVTIAEPEDFSDWLIEVDSVLDTYQRGVGAELNAAVDRLIDGERDFIVFGSLHRPNSALAQAAVEAMPGALGEELVDELYRDFIAAFESVASTQESAADVYEDETDLFEATWNGIDANGEPVDSEIFERIEEAQLEFEDTCLALTELAINRDEAPLDCFGAENGPDPDAEQPFDSARVVSGEDIDLRIGGVALTVTSTGAPAQASWGDDWLSVDDDDFSRTWWFGEPEGLADPTGDLVPDTVIKPIPLVLDLSSWANAIDKVEVLGSGSGEVGGLPAMFWDIRIDSGALAPSDVPVIALVKAEFGAPVGGLQLGFEAVWRLWTIDHPAGPRLLVLTAYIDERLISDAFDAMTEEEFESGAWPAVDPQAYLDALDTLEGYEDGITFAVE